MGVHDMGQSKKKKEEITLSQSSLRDSNQRGKNTSCQRN